MATVSAFGLTTRADLGRFGEPTASLRKFLSWSMCLLILAICPSINALSSVSSNSFSSLSFLICTARSSSSPILRSTSAMSPAIRAFFPSSKSRSGYGLLLMTPLKYACSASKFFLVRDVRCGLPVTADIARAVSFASTAEAISASCLSFSIIRLTRRPRALIFPSPS